MISGIRLLFTKTATRDLTHLEKQLVEHKKTAAETLEIFNKHASIFKNKDGKQHYEIIKGSQGSEESFKESKLFIINTFSYSEPNPTKKELVNHVGTIIKKYKEHQVSKKAINTLSTEIAQGYNKRSAAWSRFSNELLLSSLLIFLIPMCLLLRPLLQKQSLQSISKTDLFALFGKMRLAKSATALTLCTSLIAKVRQQAHVKKALSYSAEK